MSIARSKLCAAAVAVILVATPHVARGGAPIPPLAAIDRALAHFTTPYGFDAEHHARATNVEISAEAIDGKVIAPGETFSFNGAVGERTAAFGFAKSVVIRDGMLAEGMGGGTCQVASTLHAAALLAGLDVVSRTPHSRPSAYIRMGLDATVAFPSIDLRLRNPRPDRVIVHARAARGTLDVWLDSDGGDRPEVSLTSEIVERTPFPRAVERDASVPDNTVRVRAFGIPGYRVRRTREVRAPDGTARRDVRIDVYPPTAEALRVAPSFDASRLQRGAGELDLAADDTIAPAASPPVRDESGAARPTPAQLRPSTRVVLRNTP